jgi:hypothetical protein
LAFGVLFLAFFSPVLFRGTLLAAGDNLVFFLPAFLRPRTWWTPFIYSGYPIAAEPQLQMYYPLSWLCAQLGQWNLFVVTAYVVAGAGTYAYVFTLTQSIRAAVVGGTIFSLSGFLLAQLGHIAIVHGAAWIPVILWPLERLRQRRAYGWVPVAALAVANCVVGGHPHMWAYGVAVAVAYAAVSGWSAASGRAWFYSWSAFAVATGMALAAVQLLPAAELIGQTTRAEISYSMFNRSALPPREALRFLFPNLYGSIATDLYGVPVFGGNIAETAAYVGWLPLGLAVIALSSPAHRTIVRFWTLVAILMILLALGDVTPVASLVYHLPVYGGFRCPARGLVLMTLAAATLSGIGLATLERGGEPARNLARRAAAIVIASAAAGGSLIFLLRGALHTAAVAAGVSGLSLRPWENPAVGLPLVFAVAAAVAICWYGVRPSRSRAAVVALLSVLDLASFGWSLGWRVRAPDPTALERPRELERYHRVLTATHERLLTYEKTGPAYAAPANLNMLWRLATANGLTSTPLLRYQDFLLWHDVHQLRSATRALDLLAVRYVSLRPDARMGFEWDPHSSIVLHARGPAHHEWAVDEWATEIGLVAALGKSTWLEDGTIVARVDVTTGDGQTLSFPLRAGMDLSEWSYERVAGRVQHRRAVVFEEFSHLGATGHWYLARIPLGGRYALCGIRLERTARRGDVLVSRLSLRDELTGTSQPIGRNRIDTTHWRHVEDLGSLRVYENLRVMPRAWLVGRVQTLDPDQALDTIRRALLPDGEVFDPRALALVEDRVDFAESTIGPTDTVVVERIEDSAMRLQTRTTHPAFLVASDVYYEGWQAFVDGHPAPLYRANYVLRGLVVPAGEHVVEMVFQPPSMVMGFVLTLTSFPLLFIGPLIGRRFLRRSNR